MKMSGYTRLRVYFNPEYVAVTNQSGVDLGHVKFNNSSGDDNTYKLMITNTDFQQSKTVDIKINNSYIEPPVITPSSARVFFP
jgi:stress-induced morphogen